MSESKKAQAIDVLGEVHEEVLAKAVKRCRDLGVVIPTFEEMKDPSKIPDAVKEKLEDVGLWDTNPLNLFRISWRNEPEAKGGLYGDGNWVEFPPELTGCKARIVGLVGKYFPTGAHKVGAGFGCLAPRLTSGQFDPTCQSAVWPSTGNYCRGGAFDCALLGCDAIAILPEGMSKERFEWLREIGTKEIFATPGSESNVKEIYDKCWELRRERNKDIVIFNQFEEFGNVMWHYHVTGSALQHVFEKIRAPDSRFAGYVSATGSAGTIAAGDFLRKHHPHIKVVATEALQCPTLFQNGFGAHRIEGIGDKHVPWVHNVRNTDAVAAIDDEQVMSLYRLFNEKAGIEHLRASGISEELLAQLPLLGISGVCNLVAAIKAAKYFEMDGRDVVFTMLTDSSAMYNSRIEEMNVQSGAYTKEHAIAHKSRYLDGIEINHFQELGHYDRKRLHNLKYMTWVEQQGKTVEELDALWKPDTWEGVWKQVDGMDERIRAFNERTGVLAKLLAEHKK